MKKIFSLSVVVIMLLMFIPTLALAAEDIDFDSDFSVYLYGPDVNTQSTLDMDGNPIIEGNVIIQEGTFRPISWAKKILNGMIYPNTGVGMNTSISEYDISQISAQGIIAEEGKYTVNMPQVTEHGFPELAPQGDLSVVNDTKTISENGWYTNITIGGSPNTLILDVSNGKTLHIRADNISINGNIKIVGDGKVFIYADGFTVGGVSNINADASTFGNKEQLMIYLSDVQDKYSFTTTRMAGDIYVPLGSMQVGGNANINGNVYVGGKFEFMGAHDKIGQGSSKINGLLYAPNSDIDMQGTNVINGALIAKTLKIYGSATINKASITDGDFVIDEVNPVDSSEYQPGLLGSYYDASEFDNESALRMKRIDANIAYNFMIDPLDGSPHDVIEKETFAIRWTGYIKPEISGDYTFKTYSDDGIKITIDEDTVINRWGLVSLDYTLAPNKVHLEAGTYYPITVEYHQMPIFAAVFLFWEADEVPMSLVPESVFYVDQDVFDEYKDSKFLNPIEKSGTGLTNVFYVLGEDGIERVQEYSEINNLDYEWDLGAPVGITEDAFYGSVDGYIEARFTQATTLEFVIDDGISLSIDGEQVFDAMGAHSGEIVSYTFNTVAGQKYRIHIDYCDKGLGATLVMRWKGPSQEAETVPKKYLYSI